MQQDSAGEGQYLAASTTDFPSGRWSGVYWSGNRGSLCSMWLEATCAAGAISGTGFDLIGDFTIAGNYSAAGDCSFNKTYHFGHAVKYAGHRLVDGDRVGIGGNWFVDEMWGGFWLEPRRSREEDRK